MPTGPVVTALRVCIHQVDGGTLDLGGPDEAAGFIVEKHTDAGVEVLAATVMRLTFKGASGDAYRSSEAFLPVELPAAPPESCSVCKRARGDSQAWASIGEGPDYRGFCIDCARTTFPRS